MSIQPVIIIGMHRSGTTMISNMLQELGLFIGKNLDDNCESAFFIRLNDWMLEQCASRWDRPVVTDFMIIHNQLNNLIVDYLKYVLKNYPVHSFVGLRRYIAGTTPMNMQSNWGWKDPRNTFTLPVWLSIFPEAKVLHIYRNGIDVASSLKVRSERQLQASEEIHNNFRRLGRYKLSIKNYGFVDSARVLDLREGFKLWEEYVDQAFSYTENFDGQILHVCYEDFLKSPYSQMEKIAHFCKLTPSETLLRTVTGKVIASRGFAYKDNDELQALSHQMKDSIWMNNLGYNDN